MANKERKMYYVEMDEGRKRVLLICGLASRLCGPSPGKMQLTFLLQRDSGAGNPLAPIPNPEKKLLPLGLKPNARQMQLPPR
jgi:hypothetical protein